ncbi:MerR family transcriptional regulator [Lentzea chajnantorensis]
MWTLDELLERVSAALTAEYQGAPNGRVRDVPDRRAVRWYATTGLVDRPSAMRGRTALYDRRHLLQLVAVKRLQSEGRTLADIQAELAGATDQALLAIARVPDGLLEVAEEAPAGEVRPRFWAAPAAPPAPPAPPPLPAPPTPPPPLAGTPWPAVAPLAAPPAGVVPPSAPAPPAGAAPPPSPMPPAGAVPQPSPVPPAGAVPPPVPATPPSPPEPAARSGPPAPPAPDAPAPPALLTGIPLTGGAVLLTPGTPTPADLADIAAAARPLLDLLAARGLLTDERETP